jgi:AbrB family looped-hinge helix DNA binding protein
VIENTENPLYTRRGIVPPRIKSYPIWPNTVTVRVGTKGRLTIPQAVRQQLGIQPGETFFLQHEDGVLRFAKAENPFDALADFANAEYEAGRTPNFRAVAEEMGVPIGDD